MQELNYKNIKTKNTSAFSLKWVQKSKWQNQSTNLANVLRQTPWIKWLRLYGEWLRLNGEKAEKQSKPTANKVDYAIQTIHPHYDIVRLPRFKIALRKWHKRTALSKKCYIWTAYEWLVCVCVSVSACEHYVHCALHSFKVICAIHVIWHKAHRFHSKFCFFFERW